MHQPYATKRKTRERHLDPAFAPGTGTPEPGGLTSREALDLLRGLVGLNIIGGDVVEVAPQYDTSTVTAQNGAQMLFEILCLVAKNPLRKVNVSSRDGGLA